MEKIKKYYASITELRERIKLIKRQLENNDTFQTELKQIESWLESEDISFAEYDDCIVRYLIDSICVTDDQKLLLLVSKVVQLLQKSCTQKQHRFRSFLRKSS